MFIRRWLSTKFTLSEKEMLEKKGLWGDTEETIDYYQRLLKKATFNNATLEKRQNIRLQVRSPNVDHLVLQLQKANKILEQEERIEADVKTSEKVVLNLDQFLLTVNRMPVPIQSAATLVSTLTEEFVNWLGIFRSEGSSIEGYYRRHYNWLLADARRTLEAIHLASDQA